MTCSVFIGETEFHDQIYGTRFKQKLNQVGTFQFIAITDMLTDTEYDLLSENYIVRIYVDGINRFEGYITKVTESNDKCSLEVEGLSLAGIFTTRATRTPVILRGGVDSKMVTASQVVQQAVFRFGGFADDGSTGFRIDADDGSTMFFYKFESQSILNHIVNAAKISGYDWRVYIGDS